MTRGKKLGSRVRLVIRRFWRTSKLAAFITMALVLVGVGIGFNRGLIRLTTPLDAPILPTPIESSAHIGTGLGATGRGHAYGIFVSIGDFPGKDRDLPGHGELSQRMADAFIAAHLMEADQAIVLRDEQATLFAFRDAVTRLSLRLTREDLLVVYFATHGGPNALELSNGDMLGEEELHAHLIAAHSGAGLFVADACFSGSLDWAMPARVENGTVWLNLYSTENEHFSYGEFLSEALIRLVPELGMDDGSVSFDDLLVATQFEVERAARLRLSPELLANMRVNALGPGDAILWRAHVPRIALRE